MLYSLWILGIKIKFYKNVPMPFKVITVVLPVDANAPAFIRPKGVVVPESFDS